MKNSCQNIKTESEEDSRSKSQYIRKTRDRGVCKMMPMKRNQQNHAYGWLYRTKDSFITRKKA